MTDGPTDQPAPRRAVGQAVPLGLDPGEVGAEDRRRSRRASVTTVTEIVETEPGGRYGFSRAIDLGRAMREPDAQAGEGVGLAGGPHDDRPG